MIFFTLLRSNIQSLRLYNYSNFFLSTKDVFLTRVFHVNTISILYCFNKLFIHFIIFVPKTSLQFHILSKLHDSVFLTFCSL